MEEKELVNPLRKETVVVRFLPKPNANFGGMLDNGMRTFTVPIISSTGSLKNVLTKEEKDYFENLMGVNLSVHNKVNNYWTNFKVRLERADNVLDLSNPDDYLKYKVLLTNSQLICPSVQELEKRRLATYQYVIISAEQEDKLKVSKRNLKKECFKLAEDLAGDYDTLKTLVESLDKRMLGNNTTLEFLQNKLDEFIDNNATEAYRVLTNPILPSMSFIRKCVGAGLIVKSGDFYYLKSGKSKVPMCDDGRDPNIDNAVKFINNPKNQEIKFSLEAQLKNPEEKKAPKE